MIERLIREVIKPSFKPAVALITAFSILVTLVTGCAPQWEYKWDIGETQEKTEYTGKTKHESSTDLSISLKPGGSVERGYLLEIRKNVVSSSYEQIQTENYAIDRQHRNWKDNRAEVRGRFAAVFAVLGMIGGVLWGVKISDDNGWNDDNSAGAALKSGLVIFGIGAVCGIISSGVGYAFGSAASANVPNPMSQPTGMTRRRVLGTDKEWQLISQSTESSNAIAPRTMVTISSRTLTLRSGDARGKLITTLSDDNGIVQVNIVRGLENWASTKARLVNRLENLEIMRGVKPAAEPGISAFLLDHIREVQYSLTVETTEMATGNPYSSVNNAKEEIQITGYEVTQEGFNSACKKFIDQEINQNIRQVRIQLRDIDSKSAVPRSSVSCKFNSPAPKILLSDYFDATLSDRFVSKVSNYRLGTVSSTTDPNGLLVADIHLPCSLELSISIPGYHNVVQQIYLTSESTTKVLYISKSGTDRRAKVEDL